MVTMRKNPEDLSNQELVNRLQRSIDAVNAQFELIFHYGTELVERNETTDTEELEETLEQLEEKLEDDGGDDGDNNFRVDDTLY